MRGEQGKPGAIHGIISQVKPVFSRVFPSSPMPAQAKAPVSAAPRGKLLHKLLLLFLALSIVPILLARFFLIGVSDYFIQKESRGVKLAIAQKIAGNVEAYMVNIQNILQVAHKSGDFLSMNRLNQTAIMSNVMNAYPMFMRMAVLGLDGREVAAVNRISRQESPRDNTEALRTVLSAGYYQSFVSRSQEGYPRITIGVPIERIPARPLGVLLGVVNLIDLSSLIKDLVVGKNGYVYIVDMNKRQLIAHPDIQTLLSPNPPPEVSAALLTEEGDSGAVEFTDQKGNKFLNTYATVQHLRFKWRVIVQQPTEEAYMASSQMRSKVNGLLVVVVVIVAIVAYGMSRAVVGRVLKLQAAMELVGEGKFDVPAVPASNDEFGALAEKFLWMAHSLKDKTYRLISAQFELRRWNSELERRVQERTRALQEAQERLIAQEKLAALGQMASVVGHELRNPLAVMNNSVYFLKTKLLAAAGEAGLDNKMEKHIRILESEIVKSNMIIRDILDFARNRALNTSTQKVDELVEKAIERIQLPPHVTVKKALGLPGGEAVLDEDEIRQVLVNLMENACQAMPSGGTLFVGTKTQGKSPSPLVGEGRDGGIGRVQRPPPSSSPTGGRKRLGLRSRYPIQGAAYPKNI